MADATARRILRRELVILVAATVAAVCLAGAVAVHRASDLARADTEAEVTRTTTTLANKLIAPLVDDPVRRGDVVALDALDRVATSRLDPHGVLRITVWGADGRVLYSTHRELMGARFELDGQRRSALLGQTVVVDLDQLGTADDTFAADPGPLLETYVGTMDADGEPVLVETYSSGASIRLIEGQLRDQGLLSAAAVGGVLLVVILSFVLASARRLSESIDRQMAARANAVRSAETERSRLAAYLHDEVIQDLAGTGYLLGATRRTLATVPESLTSSRLDQVQAHVEHSVGLLRTVLAELYPPQGEDDLVPRLRDLCDFTARKGVQPALIVPERFAASPVPAVAVYRVAREALRNVVAHADASSVSVVLSRDGAGIRLEVVDDGHGFDMSGAGSAGHMGLRLMRDVASDVGGRLIVDSEPGGGTSVRLWVADAAPSAQRPRTGRVGRRTPLAR